MIETLTIGVDMSLNLARTKILSSGLMMCLLSGCFHPPYNNFRNDHRATKMAGGSAVVGGLASAAVVGGASSTIIGAAIGGTVGMVIGASHDSKKHLIKELQKQDIQYVQYGDTMTLIIPTDKYFMINSPRLNELLYPGLTNVVRLLRLYPKNPIYVAGFTDNVGSARHKKLMSQAQAETILSYLWANGIAAERLKAEGYGDKNDISDNNIIHGSAQNRRIEIQWFTGLIAQAEAPVMSMK